MVARGGSAKVAIGGSGTARTNMLDATVACGGSAKVAIGCSGAPAMLKPSGSGTRHTIVTRQPCEVKVETRSNTQHTSPVQDSRQPPSTALEATGSVIHAAPLSSPQLQPRQLLMSPLAQGRHLRCH